MGCVLSNDDDRREGQPWDVRWSHLERGLAPKRQLSASDVVLLADHSSKRSYAAEMTRHIHRREQQHVWDARWSQLERDLALEERREAMAARVQWQLQQRPAAVSQSLSKEKVDRAAPSDRGADGLAEEAAVMAAARAGGA